MRRTAILVSMLALAGTSFAQGSPTMEEDGLQRILKQQTALRVDLEDGGIDGLTPRQNTLVRKAQVEVFAITEGKKSLEELSMEEKVRLENALERINAQVANTRAASDRQNVCWRERMSGTTIKKTRCGTQAEMREAREGARDFLEKGKVCVPPGCGGG